MPKISPNRLTQNASNQGGSLYLIDSVKGHICMRFLILSNFQLLILIQGGTNNVSGWASGGWASAGREWPIPWRCTLVEFWLVGPEQSNLHPDYGYFWKVQNFLVLHMFSQSFLHFLSASVRLSATRKAGKERP